jgi:hypothetical protein
MEYGGSCDMSVGVDFLWHEGSSGLTGHTISFVLVIFVLYSLMCLSAIRSYCTYLALIAK